MQNGTVISGVEVVQITAFGVWIDIDGNEYFLDREHYPWFGQAKVQEICHIELDRSGNLHWPDLDVDIELKSLEKPEEYPLVYK